MDKYELFCCLKLHPYYYWFHCIFMFSKQSGGYSRVKNGSWSPYHALTLLLYIQENQLEALSQLLNLQEQDCVKKTVNLLEKYYTINNDLSMNNLSAGFNIQKEMNDIRNITMQPWHPQHLSRKCKITSKNQQCYAHLKTETWHNQYETSFL